MRIPACRRTALCSRRINNVRWSFFLLTSISCFAFFNLPGVAQVANEESYRTAMPTGQDELDKSYKIAASADQKAKDAESIRTAGCKTNHSAAEARAKLLLRESNRLTEDANGFARKALDHFRLAETLKPKLHEPTFGQALALL